MRLGFDAKRAFMNRTGLGVYSRNLINYMIENSNHDVLLFTPDKRIDFLSVSKKYSIILPHILIPKILHSVWRSLGISLSLYRWRPDIYHGLSAELPLLLPKGTIVLVTVHDLLFERYPQDYSLSDRFLARWKVRHACKVSDKIIAISESTKNDLISFYGVDEKKIDVIPVPVQSQPIPKNFKEKPREEYLVYISSFQYRKNQLGLIKAFEKIADDVPFNLKLIGSGRKYLKQCKTYLKNSSIHNRVEIIQDATDQEVATYYTHALFSVYPSMYEGFGIPIIESLAYLCPVLASDAPSHKEILDKEFLFFDRCSTESLADKLREMWENLSEYRHAQLSKRELIVEKYSISRIGQQIEELYHHLHQ